MNAPNRQAVIDGMRAQMDAFGISTEELRGASTWPTAAEAVANIRKAKRGIRGPFGEKTLKNYKPNWTVFETRHGDTPLDEIHDEDIEEDLDIVHMHAKKRLDIRNELRIERGQLTLDWTLFGSKHMYLAAVKAVFARQ